MFYVENIKPLQIYRSNMYIG